MTWRVIANALFVLPTHIGILYPWILEDLFQSCSFLGVKLEHAANDGPGFPGQQT